MWDSSDWYEMWYGEQRSPKNSLTSQSSAKYISFFVMGLSCGGDTWLGEWYGLISVFRGPNFRGLGRLLLYRRRFWLYPLFHDDPRCGWSSLLSTDGELSAAGELSAEGKLSTEGGDWGVSGAVNSDNSSEPAFGCFKTFFSAGVVGISGSKTQIDIACSWREWVTDISSTNTLYWTSRKLRSHSKLAVDLWRII